MKCKSAIKIDKRGRTIISQNLIDAVNDNDGFEKCAYLVIDVFGKKKVWNYPVKNNRVTIDKSLAGRVLVISYDSSKGQFFKISEIPPYFKYFKER